MSLPSPRRKWARPTIAILAGLVLADLALFALLPLQALHPTPLPPDRAPAAVAAILFHGFTPERTGIDAETKRRITHGLSLLIEGKAGLLLVAGGNRRGQEVNGARLMAEYLRVLGVAEDQLIIEDQSRDSRSNLDRIRDKLRARGLASAALVSSPHHLLRISALPGHPAAGFTLRPYDPTACVPPLTRTEIWRSAHSNLAAWLAAVLLPERMYAGIVAWVRTHTAL